MSVYVVREVWEHSAAEHGALLTLLALSDSASKDEGVGWPSQLTLMKMTKLGERGLRDSLRWLEENVEIETRQAMRRRTKINVYRVLVGDYATRVADLDEIPFRLFERFSTPAEVAARKAKRPPAENAGGQETTTGEKRRPGAAENAGDDRQKTPLSMSPDPKEEPSAAEPKGPSGASIVLGETEPGDLVSSAAAPAEPPSLEQVFTVIRRLRGWDAGTIRQVEPLALQLSAAAFVDAAETVLHRRTAKNPPGLLIHLLNQKIAEQRHAAARTAAESAPSGPTGIEKIKRDDPDRYVRAMATFPLTAEIGQALEEYLDAYVDEPRRPALKQLVAELRAETPSQSMRRWVDERACLLPETDARAVIDSWEIDPVERADLHDRHDELRATRDQPDTGQGRRAA